SDVVHDQLDFPGIPDEMDDQPCQQPTEGHHRDDRPALEEGQASGKVFQDDPIGTGHDTADQSEQGPEQEGPAEHKGIEPDGLVQNIQIGYKFPSSFKFHLEIFNGKSDRSIPLFRCTARFFDGPDDDGGVDAGILDEPFMGLHSPTDHPGQIKSLDIGLHGPWVIGGKAFGVLGEFNAQFFQKVKVRHITGQCQDKVIFKSDLPFGRVKEDTVFLDFLDGGIVKDLYAAFLDTVNNVGTDPV